MWTAKGAQKPADQVVPAPAVAETLPAQQEVVEQTVVVEAGIAAPAVAVPNEEEQLVNAAWDPVSTEVQGGALEAGVALESAQADPGTLRTISEPETFGQVPVIITPPPAVAAAPAPAVAASPSISRPAATAAAAPRPTLTLLPKPVAAGAAGAGTASGLMLPGRDAAIDDGAYTGRPYIPTPKPNPMPSAPTLANLPKAGSFAYIGVKESKGVRGMIASGGLPLVGPGPSAPALVAGSPAPAPRAAAPVTSAADPAVITAAALLLPAAVMVGVLLL